MQGSSVGSCAPHHHGPLAAAIACELDEKVRGSARSRLCPVPFVRRARRRTAPAKGFQDIPVCDPAAALSSPLDLSSARRFRGCHNSGVTHLDGKGYDQRMLQQPEAFSRSRMLCVGPPMSARGGLPMIQRACSVAPSWYVLSSSEASSRWAVGRLVVTGLGSSEGECSSAAAFQTLTN